MENSVKKELTLHILDKINDGILTNENRDEWHFYAFNEDYYIIGYYEASQWLKRHNIGEFEAANICNQYEIDIFGGTSNKYDNSETVVNMLTYIYGEELIYSLNSETIEELKENLQTELN
jgi:hypothetical protein